MIHDTSSQKAYKCLSAFECTKMDHSLHNQATKAQVESDRQHHLEDVMKKDQSRHEQAHRKTSIGSVDHTAHVVERKETLDEIHSAETDRHAHKHSQHHDEATDRRRSSLTSKQQMAHSSTERLERAQSRKELVDKLQESESNWKRHEMDLKQGLVEANRHDHLEGIKERQAHLQGH